MASQLLNQRLLILAASEPELVPLRAALGNDFSRTSLGVVGVGIAGAAAGATRLLLKEEDRSALVVLFVGSCGCIDITLPLMQVVVATESVLADSGIAAQHSYFPGTMVTRHPVEPTLEAEIRRCVPQSYYFGPIATTTAISSDSEYAQALWNSTGARFENLELFGVAEACSALQVPWSAISVVTNHTSENAHHEWVQNARPAAELTAKGVVMLLERWFATR